MSTIIIIPARLKSARLPKKLLLNVAGKPLLQHTWENCIRTGLKVVITTCNLEIMKTSVSFGAEVIMTGECDCGSKRVAEANRTLAYDKVINVQGEWPTISESTILKVASNLDHHSVCSACFKSSKCDNPSRVKTILDVNGMALYFSRLPIPYGGNTCLIHIGLYGFTKESLEAFSQLPDTKEGRAEKLEQLRMIQNGIPIYMDVVDEQPYGIDGQESYDLYLKDIND